MSDYGSIKADADRERYDERRDRREGNDWEQELEDAKKAIERIREGTLADPGLRPIMARVNHVYDIVRICGELLREIHPTLKDFQKEERDAVDAELPRFMNVGDVGVCGVLDTGTLDATCDVEAAMENLNGAMANLAPLCELRDRLIPKMEY